MSKLWCITCHIISCCLRENKRTTRSMLMAVVLMMLMMMMIPFLHTINISYSINNQQPKASYDDATLNTEDPPSDSNYTVYHNIISSLPAILPLLLLLSSATCTKLHPSICIERVILRNVELSMVPLLFIVLVGPCCVIRSTIRSHDATMMMMWLWAAAPCARHSVVGLRLITL